MSEFDELVASPGVFMAGRFGPDGRIAEHKSKSLYVANSIGVQRVTRRRGGGMS